METFRAEINGFIVNLEVETKLKEHERTILYSAVRHMASRLGSTDFNYFCNIFSYEKKITTGKWWWKKTTATCVNNFKKPNGRTRKQIYSHLMNGAETLSPTPNRQADITLRVDRRNKKNVLGYTYANSPKQWVYSWLLKTDYKRVAGNLAHEWVHKMGYGHAYRWNNTRQYTVPYAVGDYVAGIMR